MNIKQMKQTLAIICIALVSNVAAAEFSIIVHPSNNSMPDAKEIERIFMGKSKSLKPFVLADEKVKEEFNQTIANKSSSQVKSNWARLTFTGKGMPPKELSNADMLSTIASTPDAIGFIQPSALSDNVKVVNY